LVSKKVVPIATCNPWKPVIMKNVEPNLESEIENGASAYSRACSIVNNIPSITVIARATTLFLYLFFRMWWCAHVTETPEETKRIVFRSGILMGLNISIDSGGHCIPISTTGVILLCKKAQKNAAKNSTSEEINITIPYFKMNETLGVWFPSERDSR
jgi:hypothetical protein